MQREQVLLSEQVIEHEPLGVSGASGNPVDRVTLADGRVLVRKRVSPEWDWISRATGDRGRALAMWQAGVFDRMPEAIDHAVVSVEPDGSGWTVFMRDVSAHLFPPGGRIGSDEVRRVLGALAQLHRSFLDAPIPDLCSLVDRYHLLSPRTARRETERKSAGGDLISRCWDAFVDLAPKDVGEAIVALAENPEPLAAELARHPQTLVHGDVRLSNLGLSDDVVVIVDWGERTGRAPAPVEIASFLVFDAKFLDVSRDEVIAEYRKLTSDFVDDAAVDLGLIGGLVQLGCHPVLELVLHGGDSRREEAERELAWWSSAVREAFERTWAPN